MNRIFPLNYFLTIFNATKCFSNRRYLKIWQRIILLLLLTSILLIPISIHLTTMERVYLTDYFPQPIQLIDQEVMNDLQANFGRDTVIRDDQEGVIKTVETQTISENMLNSDVKLIFATDEYLIANNATNYTIQPYYDRDQLLAITDVEEFVVQLSADWFQANRLAVMLSNLAYIWLLIVISLILIIVGSTFFIGLMKKNQRFDIHSFDEANQLTFNTLGVPTLLSAMLGILILNPVQILTLHGLFYVLMLIWVYYKTHFNDTYVLEKLELDK